MKSIIIIQLCVLLLTIVSDGVKGRKIDEILDIIRRMSPDDRINGVLQPLQGGWRCPSSFGIYHAGILHPMGVPVAIKISLNLQYSENEYEMFRHLNAINDPNVWVYGVPHIYYTGMWQDCAIMAMTAFDHEFRTCCHERNFTEMDLLILFREFVRIAKYMHSRDVVHRHFAFTTMMFRKQHGFISDYSLGVKLPIGFTLEKKLELVRKDWQKFFGTAYRLIRKLHWDWLGFDETNDDHKQRMEDPRTLADSLENDSASDERHQFTPMKKVFVEFAKYAYSNATTPESEFYDRVYKVIVKEIKRYAEQHQLYVIPSWLSDQDKHDAISAPNPIPPISSIADPFQPASSGGSEKRHRGETSSSASKRSR